MKYILFISLLFISCSKNSESNSINEDENLASETEQVSNENYEPIYRHPADEQPDMLSFSPTIEKIRRSVQWVS